MEELEEFAFAGCPDVMAPKEGDKCTSCVSHQVKLIWNNSVYNIKVFVLYIFKFGFEFDRFYYIYFK